MQLAVFEDEELSNNFKPLTWTKAIFELMTFSGRIFELYSKIVNPGSITLHPRRYLENVVLRRYKVKVGNLDEGEVFLVNSCTNPEHLAQFIKREGRFACFVNGKFLFGKLSKNDALKVLNGKQREINADKLNLERYAIFEYPWEFLDIARKVCWKFRSELSKEEQLIVSEKARTEPNITFDLTNGKVIVDDNAVIYASARICGPTYIGKNTLIKPCFISASYIGDVCKIGCEVNDSIIEGYTNCAHAGFIGDSYIGSWVNIGALTTFSNLKNTYGTIRMKVNGKLIETGKLKLGCFVADYVKISIGSMIYSGKKIGVCSHAHGYVVDDIPSFTIYARKLGLKLVELNLDSAIETQRRMMMRRGVSMRDDEIDLLQKVFEMTKDERFKKGVEKKRFSLEDT
jgi:UDP-N-acetylglucosamine diphosphorylase/glucosamine-1-phosphate N-acetyltransferase